jgi:hypothetical protein
MPGTMTGHRRDGQLHLLNRIAQPPRQGAPPPVLSAAIDDR